MQTNWLEIGPLGEIPLAGGRYADTPLGQIALLRNERDEVFAVENRCPHRGGPLSEGYVSGTLVFCPLHNWQIDLCTGTAMPPDVGSIRTWPVRVEDGRVFIGIPHEHGEESSDDDGCGHQRLA